MVVLNKVKWNGKESYYQCEIWVKVYTRYLKLLLMRCHKRYQFWVNLDQGFYFIPEPRNFTEVTRLSEYINKPWLMANLKEINNLINNKTFLVDEPEKG